MLPATNGDQAVKVLTGHKSRLTPTQRRSSRTTYSLLPTLLALGGTCSLLASTANALELGEMRVQSSLGQPFRASIPFVLNPNEQLFDFCITLRPGSDAAGVPSITRPKVNIVDGNIVLAGTTPIMEPLLTVRVGVDCPYTAHLSREYTLLMSPTAPVQDAIAANEQAVVSAPAQSSNATTLTIAQATTNRPEVATIEAPTEPVAANSRYFVLPGDSLSGIAGRIVNRPVDAKSAMDAIFANNPDAFVDNDVNRLTAAIWINIPDLTTVVPGDARFDVPVADETNPQESAVAEAISGEPVIDDSGVADEYDTEIEAATESYTGFIETGSTATTTAETLPDPVSAEAIAETAVEPVAEVQEASQAGSPAEADETIEASTAEIIVSDTAVSSPVVAAESAADTASGIAEETPGSSEIDAAQFEGMVIDASQFGDAVDDTAVLRPGDAVADVDTAAASIDTSAVPVVSRPANEESGMSLWLMVAAGTLIAMLGALFAFGGRIRERFFPGKPPVAPAIADELLDDEATREATIIDDVDFQFDGKNLGDDNLELDADLGDGAGLSDSGNLDVAQDFGFSTSDSGEQDDAVDLEFPAEPAEQPELMPTDIIEPSHRIVDDAIVAVEAPPVEQTQSTPEIDGGDDYDMSMIVDATKQPLGEDEFTAMDLQAVRVDDGSPVEEFGKQTLASDADIAALEQDYQDEFTQTMALNEEIARAAEELALRMDGDDTAEVTSRLEEVADPAMTATVQAPVEAENDILSDDEMTEIAGLDDLSDLDDTGVNPAITAKVPVAGNDVTVEMPASAANEPTVEMAKPGNDATVEMSLEEDDETKAS